MAFWRITATKHSGWEVDHLGCETEIRSNSDFSGEQYAEMMRLVMHQDVKSLENLVPVLGFESVPSGIGPVSFRGGPNHVIHTPNVSAGRFGPWKLIRQSIDATESAGSEILRVTHEYVSRRVIASGDDEGEIKYTDFDWSV